jgi:hypothetical protein
MAANPNPTLEDLTPPPPYVPTPSNTSKPRTHERKPNNQPSRSFLAYLAFHSIFFQHESDGEGLISLFSHKVHSFSAMMAPAAQERDIVRGGKQPPYIARWRTCSSRTSAALNRR